MEVNYRWKKHYKTAKYPIRQPRWLTWVIWMLSKCALIGKNYKLETIDMEGLEPPYIIFSNHMAFIDFELAERNARIYDPCYAATAVLSETFGKDDEGWLKTYRDIICGYDTVARLTEVEWEAIPYVILANQFVCVAWFSEQEKFAEIFETNKRMTVWLIGKFEELKDI